ncbi:MAG: hypothetical protein DPW18_01675 [Chloroflexi bacterium]|nr:hypothetical protein [Chloroflexota bacterium]MDL1943724.1 hypothetical protein [Chloroflexi bacterium CFX2]
MNILPVLKTGRLIALFTPHAGREESMALIAELALRGAVTVLDGGNRFMPYRVAQLLRRNTVDLASVSKRVFLRRAFTCYEMNSLLADTPAFPQPYIVLDLLHTFYDDHVPIGESNRLLISCLGQIHRLGLSAPVVVTLAPPLAEERAFLIEQVCAGADQLFTPGADVPRSSQLSLF